MIEGLSNTVFAVVDDGNTAAAVGSGDMAVFATPAMIALMERAAAGALEAALPEGSTTVGVRVEAEHLRATGRGVEVSATATVERVEGRRIVFSVTADDPDGVIGQGTHERVVVDRARFMSRVRTVSTVRNPEPNRERNAGQNR